MRSVYGVVATGAFINNQVRNPRQNTKGKYPTDLYGRYVLWREERACTAITVVSFRNTTLGRAFLGLGWVNFVVRQYYLVERVEMDSFKGNATLVANFSRNVL